MTSASNDYGYASPGRRWFVIAPESEPDRALETFEEAGWAPAILHYAERIRGGAFDGPASLREARADEIPRWEPSLSGSPGAGI